MSDTVKIAYCPEHGLHGSREYCYVCNKPVEQPEFAPAADLAAADLAVIDLGRALEWALYWIAREGVVPTPDFEQQDEWERWAQARKALKRHGPESEDGVKRQLEQATPEKAAT